jgi:hypothetical protein
MFYLFINFLIYNAFHPRKVIDTLKVRPPATKHPIKFKETFFWLISSIAQVISVKYFTLRQYDTQECSFINLFLKKVLWLFSYMVPFIY